MENKSGTSLYTVILSILLDCSVKIDEPLEGDKKGQFQFESEDPSSHFLNARKSRYMMALRIWNHAKINGLTRSNDKR